MRFIKITDVSWRARKYSPKKFLEDACTVYHTREVCVDFVKVISIWYQPPVTDETNEFYGKPATYTLVFSEELVYTIVATDKFREFLLGNSLDFTAGGKS